MYITMIIWKNNIVIK